MTMWNRVVFPRSVGPQETHDLSTPDIERDLVDHSPAPIRLDDPVRVEHAHRAGSSAIQLPGGRPPP